MMNARDASGRRVSLLNDESTYEPPSYYDSASHSHRSSHQRTPSNQLLSHYYSSSRSSSASPHTPELLRSDSYDSNSPGSNDPTSPLTPTVAYDYHSPSHPYLYSGHHSKYDEYSGPSHAVRKHSTYSESARSASYEDDTAGPSAVPERSAKRYPCRFRESHGCEKTFTTSGHASRHSKIHTAEKAVHCTFQGCQKKFTRADNMKQHLETHYKDKSRSSSHRASKSSSSGSSRKPGLSTRTSSSSHRSGREQLTLDYHQYGPPTPTHATPLASPATGAWDFRGLNYQLMAPHSGTASPNGLDALAMAVACQEGA